MTAKPVLIFAYGNSSRGDDALAPQLFEWLQQQPIDQACGHPVKYLSDYQIQIEHVMDMQDCERVLFIDAARDQDQAFRFYSIPEQQVTHYTTHGMTPSTLLYHYRQVLDQAPPPSVMLAIAGVDFELGQDLSPQAQSNLEQAESFIISLLGQKDFSFWDNSLERL